MIYTAEEKQKIDAVISDFEDYIKQKKNYDLLYSEKMGYVRIHTAFEVESMVMKTADQLLRHVLDDIMLDVLGRPEYGERMDYTLSDAEKDAIREYLNTPIQTTPEKMQYYSDCMEKVIISYTKRGKDD